MRVLKLCLFVCSVVGLRLVGSCIDPDIWCSGIYCLSLTWRQGVFNWVFNSSLKVEPCIAFPYVPWSDTIIPCCSFFWRRDMVWSWEVLSGNIHTPIILESCYGGSLSVGWYPYWFLRERWALLFARGHFPAGSQVNSRRYHFFLNYDLSSHCPLYIWNIIETFWASLTVSYVEVLWYGVIWTIV